VCGSIEGANITVFERTTVDSWLDTKIQFESRSFVFLRRKIAYNIVGKPWASTGQAMGKPLLFWASPVLGPFFMWEFK
jgi:hypothetical protein